MPPFLLLSTEQPNATKLSWAGPFGGVLPHARLAAGSQIHFSGRRPFMRDVSHDQRTVETDGRRRKYVAIGEIARVRPLNLKGRDAPRIRLEDHTIEPPARRGY